MKKLWSQWKWLPMVVAGCAIFSLGFDLFLEPHDTNCGGLSGLAQVCAAWSRTGTVGLWTAVMNIPLFIIGGKAIGKRFFFGSLVGMLSMAGFLDLFVAIPAPQTDPILGALYGGVITGVGMGLVFLSGVSSGGTDIVVRLVKLRKRDMPVGRISLCLDVAVALLTGIAFHDFTRTLYGGIALYMSSRVIDAVIYRFDYSKVAMIISPKYEEISEAIDRQLMRGVTLLDGAGYYSRKEIKVILSASKRQQVTDLKELVTDIDPDAFIILQEAHQVLGDGFSRYSRDDL